MSDVQIDDRDLQRRKLHGRSRISNGSTLLPGVDGRSSLARRFRDVLTLILAEVKVANGGNELSESQKQDARRAAGLIIECEKLEDQTCAGGIINSKTYALLSQQQGRVFSRLGLKRSPQRVDVDAGPGPLGKILNERPAAAPAPADEREPA